MEFLLANYYNNIFEMIKILLIVLTIILSQAQSIPKIIWSYWDTGDNVGIFTKLCFDNMKRYAEEDGWELRILNHQTVYKYLPQIDDFIENPIYRKFLSHLWARADLIRLSLLTKYGGVWIDANSFFIQKLSWISDLKNNKDVMNKLGFEPNLIMFNLEQLGSKQQVKFANDSIVKVIPGLQTWFIACVPNSQIINDWYNTHIQSIKNITLHQEISDQNQINYHGINIFRQQHHLMLHQTLQIPIQLKQRQIDNNRNRSLPRTYAVHYYKIWTLSARLGPIRYYVNTNQNQKLTLNLLHVNYEKVKQKYGEIRYFVKNSQRRYKMQSTILTALNQQQSFTNVLSAYLHFFPCFFNCSVAYRIQQNSLIHNYLLKNTNIKHKIQISKPAWNPQFNCSEYLSTFRYEVFLFILALTLLIVTIIYRKSIQYILSIKFQLYGFFYKQSKKQEKVSIELKQQQETILN